MHLKSITDFFFKACQKNVSYWSNCQFRSMSRSNTEVTNQSNPAATLMQAQSLRFTAVFNLFVAGRQKKTDKHRKKRGDLSLMQRITWKGGRSSKDNKDFKSDWTFFLAGETFERQIHHHVASPPSLIATERTAEDNTRKYKCAFLALGIYSAAKEQRENVEKKTRYFLKKKKKKKKCLNSYERLVKRVNDANGSCLAIISRPSIFSRFINRQSPCLLF